MQVYQSVDNHTNMHYCDTEKPQTNLQNGCLLRDRDNFHNQRLDELYELHQLPLTTVSTSQHCNGLSDNNPPTGQTD